MDKDKSAGSEIMYSCEACDSEVMVSAEGPVPVCCGKPMLREKLPQCTTAQHPEMVRNEYDDDPCDDNRAYE